jgi:hypothetical protein
MIWIFEEKQKPLSIVPSRRKEVKQLFRLPNEQPAVMVEVWQMNRRPTYRCLSLNPIGFPPKMIIPALSARVEEKNHGI